MIGVLEQLNNPNVNMYELQKGFLNSISNCMLDKNKLDSLMTCMITNQETIGLSNDGLNKDRQNFINTFNVFYNNQINQISLKSGMIR